LASLVRVLGAFSGARFDPALLWRTQSNAGASSLREANVDGLFRRSSTVLAATDSVDLLLDECAGLGRWRFARALGFLSLLQGSFLWHRPLHG